MVYRWWVYRDVDTGQRLMPLRVQKDTLLVWDLEAGTKRIINRLRWDMDLESGRLKPARAGRRVQQLLEPKEDEMATAKGKKGKVIRKAKATVAVVNKPVRPGSIKHTVFVALMKGGTAEQVAARLQAQKVTVTPKRVQTFGQWAVKRGLVVARNGKYLPGTAKLELRGKQEKS